MNYLAASLAFLLVLPGEKSVKLPITQEAYTKTLAAMDKGRQNVNCDNVKERTFSCAGFDHCSMYRENGRIGLVKVKNHSGLDAFVAIVGRNGDNYELNVYKAKTQSGVEKAVVGFQVMPALIHCNVQGFEEAAKDYQVAPTQKDIDEVMRFLKYVK